MFTPIATAIRLSEALRSCLLIGDQYSRAVADDTLQEIGCSHRVGDVIANVRTMKRNAGWAFVPRYGPAAHDLFVRRWPDEWLEFTTWPMVIRPNSASYYPGEWLRSQPHVAHLVAFGLAGAAIPPDVNRVMAVRGLSGALGLYETDATTPRRWGRGDVERWGVPIPFAV